MGLIWLYYIINIKEITFILKSWLSHFNFKFCIHGADFIEFIIAKYVNKIKP